MKHTERSWTSGLVLYTVLDSFREDDAADSTGSSSDSDNSDEEPVASQSRRSLSKAFNSTFLVELSKNSPSNRDVITVLMTRLDELETSIKFNNNLVDKVQKTLKKILLLD